MAERVNDVRGVGSRRARVLTFAECTPFRLPLDSIQVAMAELVPKVNELCATIASKPDADERVLALLREQTLVGVLPPAPPIREC